MSENLFQILANAQTEEELKNFFAKQFKIKLATKNFIDLYTQQILFEFKLDKNLKNPQILAKIVAQTLYYVRRLKFGRDYRQVSKNICIVTKFNAVFFKTRIFDDFVKRKSYDWDLAPSSPCKKLIADLENHFAINSIHVYDFFDAEDTKNFTDLINRNLSNTFSLFDELKEINENNFYQIFLHWQKIFGADVENGHKSSEYFLIDIEDGKTDILPNGVLFHMTGGEYIKKFLDLEEYKNFWSIYKKISNPQVVIAIRQMMDRMTEENLRRRTGEFYTPLAFADKAIDYLRRTVGDWWLDGNFRLWDMAAGTGNLEYDLPADALKFCYISTLLPDDADYCKRAFSDATVFQYDYLNDDADKLPKNLRGDLANPNIKWIIFINPPYATASNFERDINRQNKDGVSMTAIREQMTAENLGEVSRELTTQFLYRISRDFKCCQAWLGMFSKIKYINSNNDQNFRDKVFSYEFERGFIFSSKSFDGCTGQFPVGFLIWNLGKQISLHEQEISIDIYDSDVEKVATKTFRPERREDFLNKWIKRPRCTKKFPPLSSALNIAAQNKDRRDRVAENFLASFMCVANDFTHQNYTAILSGPYVSAGAFSITPENFEQSMIVHMVRRLPKATWLNDRDQFMQPTCELSREFICDAVIWSLFAPSNQTVSLRNVEYEGEIYRIPNNFFQFELSELENWECSSPEMRMRIAMAREDRFAAMWIKKHRDELSAAAISVLNAARAIYKRFYAELNRLDVRRWKISDWDAGWYQIRMSLGATIDLSELSTKLLPQIYELGFLRDEVRYF